jgi:hypothetical protein
MQAPTEITAYQGLDLAIKGVGGLVAVIGAWTALGKYLREKRKENETAKIESQKPFLTKRQEVYFDLLAVSASIATKAQSASIATKMQDDEHRKDAEDKFWQLYWGAFPVVADDKVSMAAWKSAEVLKDKSSNAARLQDASMDLALACRTSLGQSWDIGLSIYRQSGDETPIGNPRDVAF